jgi:hypothetical protein
MSEMGGKRMVCFRASAWRWQTFAPEFWGTQAVDFDAARGVPDILLYAQTAG